MLVVFDTKQRDEPLPIFTLIEISKCMKKMLQSEIALTSFNQHYISLVFPFIPTHLIQCFTFRCRLSCSHALRKHLNYTLLFIQILTQCYLYRENGVPFNAVNSKNSVYYVYWCTVLLSFIRRRITNVNAKTHATIPIFLHFFDMNSFCSRNIFLSNCS